MLTYDVNLCMGMDDPDNRVSVKCHDTGVSLRVNFQTCQQKKWTKTYTQYALPKGATLVMNIVKPDKKYCVKDGIVQGNTGLFELPPQAFILKGECAAEVQVYGADGRRITSGTFYIDVRQEVFNECEKDSKPYISVMGQQIQAAVDAAGRAEGAAENAKSSEENAAASEKAANASAQKAGQAEKSAGGYIAMMKQGLQSTTEEASKAQASANAAASSAQAAAASAEAAREAAENGGGVKVTAEVGQTILVTEVDANGKPTKWEAADYQPRTHWLEGREVLPETMCGLPHEDSDTTDGGVAILSNHIGLVEGESYKVTYTTEVNGTREYTCVCKKYTNVDGDWLYLGNGIIIGGNSNYTEDPFTIAEHPNTIAEYPNGTTWCFTSYPGTLSVCTSNYQMHKLPVEFLPDGVPYLVESEKAEILPETKLINEGEDSDEYFFMEVIGDKITAGNTYTVKYNGTEYECAATTMAEGGMVCYILGNYGALSGGADTGEPFLAIVLPAEYADAMGVGGMVLSIDGTIPATFGISGSSVKIRKLPNELLDLLWIPEKKWVGTELIPEVTATGTKRISGISARDYLPYDRLIVAFDGVEYECIPAFSDDGNIENASMMMSNVTNPSLMPGENPNQKFLVYCDLHNTSLIPMDGGTHTYAIRTVEYSYSKLDNGYLGLDWLPVQGTKAIRKNVSVQDNKTIQNATIYGLKTVTVIYDGVKHTCDVKYYTAEEYGETEDVCVAENDKFYLWALKGLTYMYARFTDGGNHVLTILDGESYSKMPEGYLPESVDGVIVRSSTPGSTKKFKLTINDSGELDIAELT